MPGPTDENTLEVKLRKTALIGIATLMYFGAFCGQPTLANDGWISHGGTPHLMSAKGNVSMVSENIIIDIKKNLVTVDCRFQFKNHGPACSLRMGFPDDSHGMAHEGTFLTYRSYVDNIEVPTEVEKADKPDRVWHSKTVDFAEGQERAVHDIYTVKPGMKAARPRGAVKQVVYLTNTASSWDGPVKQMDITAIFDELPGPINALAWQDLPKDKDLEQLNWSRVSRNTVVYGGPSRGVVSGKSLQFHAENIRPTEKQDVVLFFRYANARQLDREEAEEEREKKRSAISPP